MHSTFYCGLFFPHYPPPSTSQQVTDKPSYARRWKIRNPPRMSIENSRVFREMVSVESFMPTSENDLYSIRQLKGSMYFVASGLCPRPLWPTAEGRRYEHGNAWFLVSDTIEASIFAGPSSSIRRIKEAVCQLSRRYEIYPRCQQAKPEIVRDQYAARSRGDDSWACDRGATCASRLRRARSAPSLWSPCWWG